MAPSRKTRKGKPRAATSGRIMEPVNITSTEDLGQLDSRIAAGPLVLVLVYADWCGHCQTFKPIMDKLENTPGRTIQTARIRDDVFPKSSLSNVPIEGYPSLLLVKNTGEPVKFDKGNGEVTTVVPEHKNVNQMTAIVKNAGTPSGLTILKQATATTPTQIANANATASAKSQNNQAYSTSPLGTQIESATRSQNTPDIFTPLTVTSEVTPPDVSVDRLTANQLTSQKNRVNLSSTPLTQEPTSKQVGGGGGLFQVLSQVAYQYGPAAAYLWAANAMAHRKKSKTRRRH